MFPKPLSLLAACGWLLLAGWGFRQSTGDDLSLFHHPEETSFSCGTCNEEHARKKSSYEPVPGTPDGKVLFMTNCASCHYPLKDACGPGLEGVAERVSSRQWLYDWVHHSQKLIASGDKYANELYRKWNKTAMTPFPQLTNEQIDAIIRYTSFWD